MLVALFRTRSTAVWVALLFIGLQQLEGHVVAPQVFGHALRINPLLVIFALLLGGQLYGIIGAFIALPIAAIAARDRRLPAPPPGARAVGTERAGARRGARPAGRGAEPPRTGAAGVRRARTPGAAYCPACGTELGPPTMRRPRPPRPA